MYAGLISSFSYDSILDIQSYVSIDIFYCIMYNGFIVSMVET